MVLEYSGRFSGPLGVFSSSSLQCISFMGQACFPRLPKLPCLYSLPKTNCHCWRSLLVHPHTPAAMLPLRLQIWLTLCYPSPACGQKSLKKNGGHIWVLLGPFRSCPLCFMLSACCLSTQEWPDKNTVFGSDVLIGALFVCTPHLKD